MLEPVVVVKFLALAPTIPPVAVVVTFIICVVLKLASTPIATAAGSLGMVVPRVVDLMSLRGCQFFVLVLDPEK